MPTVYTFLRISLLFVLLYNANLIRADMVTYEAYGVKKGQKLDFRILERPERPEFTSGMEFPGGMSMGDITNLTQLRLDNFTLQPILDSVPPKDSNFTISVESFPNITQTGVINVSYNMTECKLAISNLFGEPIISIDWDRWIQVLDNLAEQEFIYDKKIESVHYEQTNETFKSTIIIKPTIPTSMRLYLTRITINQTQCYFTTTGIQAYIVIITSFSIRIFGDFTSVLFYKYIGTDNGDIANISVPSSDFDLLHIFIPLLGSGMILISTIIALAIFIRRLKR